MAHFVAAVCHGGLTATVFFLCLAPGSPAQAAADAGDLYLIDVWQTGNGLPQNEVTSIAQTPEGYLWIGLFHGGLARFDGIHFTSFTPFNTPELIANEIQMVQTDSRGVLWIGPSDASLTSWSQGKFTTIRNSQPDAHTRLQTVLCADSNRMVFATAYGGLMQGAYNSNSITWIEYKPPVDANPSFCADREGLVWFRTSDGRLGRLEGTDLTTLTMDSKVIGHNVTAVCVGPDDRLWVGSDDGLAFYERGQFHHCSLTNDDAVAGIKAMAFAGDGSLWVLEPTGRLRKFLNHQWATTVEITPLMLEPSVHGLLLRGDRNGGLWIVNYGVGVWHVSPDGTVYQLTREQGLPSLQIESLFEDREENIWLGTTQNGLMRLRKRIFHVVGGSGLPHDSANSICEGPAGTIWLGTPSGKVFSEHDGVWNPLELPASLNAVFGNATVCSDTAGRLWIGTVGHGVWLLEKGEIRQPFPSDMVNNVSRILYADRGGRMWFGSEFGLSCWQEGVVKKFTAQEVGNPCHVTGIVEDNHGSIWISTADGRLLRVSDGKIDTFAGPTIFGKAHFWCLACDLNGALWIGTLGGGLVRFFDGKFAAVSSKQGLPNDYVTQLLPDQDGCLWAASRGGIFRMSVKDLNGVIQGKQNLVPCELFSREDGLPAVEYTAGFQPACWQRRDGRLWFTTVEGVTWINPHELTKKSAPPATFIESVRVDGNLLQECRETNQTSEAVRLPGSSALRAQSIRLAPGQHYIEFQFTGLTLTSPEKVRFRWKMERLDANWNYGGNKRSVAYSGLPPGAYQFQVGACNGDGIWNDTVDTVKLTIAPHIWQTWMFKLFLLLLIGAAPYGIYAARISRLRMLQRERLRIARDLHDEVGAGLGTIALLGEFIEDKPSASDGRAVRQMALQVIDALRDIVWFVDPSFEKFSDLAARMESTARANLPSVQLDFQSSGNGASKLLPLTFRRHILPLFKEILHNIAKHAQAKRVEIRVSQTGNRFRLLIEDDGMGFNPDCPKDGNGIMNMRRRALELGGTLEITSRPKAGTTISFTTSNP